MTAAAPVVVHPEDVTERDAETVSAVPQTFDGLRDRGLSLATVNQTIGWPLWQTRRFRRVATKG